MPLMLLSVALLEGALLCMRRLGRHCEAGDARQVAGEREIIGGSWYAGMQTAVRSPYLLAVCLYMLLFTIGSTFLYLLQAEIVAQSIADRAARAAYFAQVDIWINGLTLLLQLTLTGRSLRKLGVGLTLALLPLLSAVGFLVLAVSPVLAAVVVFQVARRVTDFALSRPAREVLYVPLPREDKYKAKNLIDTFVYRAGDQVGAWTHAGLTALGLASAGIAAIAVPISLAWVALALWLGARHRQLVAAQEQPLPAPALAYPARPPLLPAADSPLH
jgi:AAA family ATP:ADP antiporter